MLKMFLNPGLEWKNICKHARIENKNKTIYECKSYKFHKCDLTIMMVEFLDSSEEGRMPRGTIIFSHRIGENKIPGGAQCKSNTFNQSERAKNSFPNFPSYLLGLHIS